MSLASLLATLVLLGPQEGPEVDPRLLERLAAELTGAPAGAGPAALAARLQRLGPAGIPAALALLDAGELPGEEPRPLDATQSAALLASLGSFGRAALLPELDRRMLDESAPLATTLKVLGRVGSSADLERLLERVQQRVPSGSLEHEAFQAAVAGILGRTPALAGRIRQAILSASEPLAADLVRALSDLPTESTGEALVALLGQRPALDRTLLQALARVGPGLPTGLAGEAAEQARRFLDEGDEQGLLSAALLAVGGLGDCEALPALIEALENPSGGVRGNARWALERISGRAFGNEPARWRLWLESERSWYASQAPRWLAELRSGDYGRVSRALNELVQHDYRRDELAGEMCAALDDPDARIRRQVCLALERLDSRAAVEPLTACLQDEDKRVAKAAWQALKTITGQEVPVDREAWRARHGGRG